MQQQGFDTMQLDQAKQHYEANGFIEVQGLLSPEQVRAAKEALLRYIEIQLPALPASDYVMEGDGVSVRNLWRMETHDGFFLALAQSPELLSLVETLVNGRAELMGVETFNKPAQVGSAVPPHQDNAYFCQRPADVLTVWIALDAVTPENGPVSYVSGSHTGGLRPHEASGVQGNSRGLVEKLTDEERGSAFAGLLEPGDALIHHCEVVHFSEPNRSNSSRCGLLLVYRGVHTETDRTMQADYKKGLAAQQTA